ncbi:MAG: response regulator transcription factor [Anaerolineae bacterium]
MSKETVLVVDDEENIIELAKLYLENEGFAVASARDGLEALDKITQVSPVLVVLDLMLPKLDGWEVCKRIRAAGNLPIIMLTARDDDVDKIVGLELGADDYMTKPYNPRELVARVKAVLRRGYPPLSLQPDAPPQTLTLGPLTLNPAAREAHLAGRRLELRTKEFDLLHVLATHRGQALSRDQLLNLAWGFDFYGETRTVDVHIAHLRKKLGDAAVTIDTVWGVGYKLSTAG